MASRRSGRCLIFGYWRGKKGYGQWLRGSRVCVRLRREWRGGALRLRALLRGEGGLGRIRRCSRSRRGLGDRTECLQAGFGKSCAVRRGGNHRSRTWLYWKVCNKHVEGPANTKTKCSKNHIDYVPQHHYTENKGYLPALRRLTPTYHLRSCPHQASHTPISALFRQLRLAI